MSTPVHGRVGGQYIIAEIAEGKYQIKGLLHEKWHTMWTGEDYKFATKLLDYSANNDGRAQHAISQLFFQGDPTGMMELIELAKLDPTTRERRKVGVTLEIETDIMVGEGAIESSIQQITAASRMCGFRVTEVKGFYTDEGEKHRDTGRIANQRDYLLDNMVVTQDGWFHFPDGTRFPCISVEQAVKQSRLAEQPEPAPTPDPIPNPVPSDKPEMILCPQCRNEVMLLHGTLWDIIGGTPESPELRAHTRHGAV